jgi:phosphoglycerate dehydrogenase-like enzyme
MILSKGRSMSFKFVLLPPSGDFRMAARIETAVPEANVVVCEDRAQALEELADAPAAFGTLDPELLAAAHGLKWLAAPAAGPNPSFYFPELVASDVVVTNMRGIYSDHIGVHIMAFVLAFARHLHVYLPAQQRGEWGPGGEGGTSIHLPGATAVIIGVGGIGSEAARHCAHFGMHVVGIDPRVASASEGVHELYTPEVLDEQLGRGDFVIMTAPQTPQMERLIDGKRLAHMKTSGILINIGRGSNVVLDDLADALYEGRIGGAALDVFEIEPLPPGHRLWKAPNFLMTPHTAGSGPYLEERRLQLQVENCRRFARGEELANVVDKANWF